MLSKDDFSMNVWLRLFLHGAAFIVTALSVGIQSLAADPGEWRLLSRLRINPPGVRSFLETFFTYNQLKAVPGGGLALGFAAAPKERTDTDVFVSRFIRSEDRWTPAVPIAESKDLERSPELWIDGQSGAIHFAWVANQRRRGVPRSELRVGYRRSEDGGVTWSSPQQFPVGTALARRPQLLGDGCGNLYLVISNGYPGKQERIHLFQSADGGRNWRAVDVNFPEGEKRGRTGSPQLAVGPNGQASLVWLDQTAGRRAVVFSKTTGDFTWSAPVRVNDDPAMNCTEPRLAIQGNSIYVAWRVVLGSQTKLHFDHSPDGGANWNSDQVIFDRPARSVLPSLQPLERGLIAGWFESQRHRGRTNRRLAYRLYSPAEGWTVPEGENDSLAGEHGTGRFYFGFDLLPWRGGCLVAYSKGIVGVSPEIYLGWSEDPESGFSELMKISEPKKSFEHLYPRLVRSGENEVAVVYNRRKIRRMPMEPRVTLGDVVVARIGIP